MKKDIQVKNSRQTGGLIQVELTGYCNCIICSGNWGGRTAMGTRARVGVVAAPSNIALGTTLHIPHLKSYNGGDFKVEDRGGVVVKKANGVHVIDVWFPSHQQALDFGRVKTVAYIK